MADNHFDLVIVGAGLSGIGTAHQFRKEFPRKTYTILEQRDEMGGTWSLFKYPGIRSDSDMHTLGYRFKPWTAAKAIADGPSILDYVHETAREGDVERHIRYGKKVTRAEWDSDSATWTVETTDAATGETEQVTCRYLFCCTGYYDYDNPYRPEFPGEERFTGPIIHPQLWPEDLDYAGKRIVVIGSGATAVTLVPAMTDRAEHVTMLQRSPTWIVARPSEDALANKLRKHLPAMLAYGIVRWKNVLLVLLSFQISRRRPEWMRWLLRQGLVKNQKLSPAEVDKNFTPTYNPWEQRLCLVPDSDLFEALRAGKASVVTDHIETFTEKGILLKSGEELEADIIVTATGLNLIPFGGVELVVDGEKVNIPDQMTYKGIMLSDVPNLVLFFGYTNASWTLKVDLTYAYTWRLIKHLERAGLRQFTPRRDPSVQEAPFLDFNSGYVLRAMDKYPKQGETQPWRLSMNYAIDAFQLRFTKLDDGAMEFSNPDRSRERAATSA
ncbi:MAG TPA: NAD(P)/FAD-dependent oxidoreductase [Mycobacteriales bacterium]|nr:NAD(P)/FAD-dependent oxidoreductase [Mycobacteriales bacterium]